MLRPARRLDVATQIARHVVDIAGLAVRMPAGRASLGSAQPPPMPAGQASARISEPAGDLTPTCVDMTTNSEEHSPEVVELGVFA